MTFCTLQLNFTPPSHKDEYPECYVVFVKKKNVIIQQDLIEPF